MWEWLFGSPDILIPKDHSLYDKSSWLGRIFFLWINPLILLGYNRPLEASDIPPVPHDFRASYVLKQFKIAWGKEIQKKGEHANVGNAMFHAFNRDILSSSIFFIPYVGIMLMQPYFVSDILSYLAGSSDESTYGIKNGFALVCVFGFICILNGIVQSISFYYISLSGMQMKIATIAAVFDKSLRLSSTSRAKYTMGEKVTMISADAERVWYGVIFVNWIWAGPIMAIVAMALLIDNVGVAAVVAFIVMLIIIVIQGYVGKQIGAVRSKQMRFTDERTKLINESLQGIRILKFYAWESATAHRIEHIRAQEVKHLTKFQLLKMINTIIMFVGPIVIAFSLFMVHIGMGGKLTVSRVYTLYALLNVIRMPFSITPMAFASWQESRVSLRRISKYLLLEEEDQRPLLTDAPANANANATTTATASHQEEVRNGNDLEQSNEENDKESYPLLSLPSGHVVNEKGKKKLLISIKDASFAWDGQTESYALSNISLDVFASDFIAIVGSVGSGKTSLISAILGQMITREGSLETFNTRIAYVAQEHWICNTSLHQNVLFNSTLHENEYIDTIDHSQMTNDLLVLPNADYTYIGERGLNLSGGQKARVSIARALYAGYHLPLHYETFIQNLSEETKKVSPPSSSPSPIELYIFDDALASVDVHVGKALFQQAITSSHLEDKAKIVCLSSNYHYLPYFQKIIVLKDGQIHRVGDYQSIIEEYPEYALGLNNSSKNNNNNEINNNNNNNDDDVDSLAKAMQQQQREQQREEEDGKDNDDDDDDDDDLTKGKSLFRANYETIEQKRHHAQDLMTAEDREKGAVAFSTYVEYFSNAFTFFAHFLAQRRQRRRERGNGNGSNWENRLKKVNEANINRHYEQQGNQIVIHHHHHHHHHSHYHHHHHTQYGKNRQEEEKVKEQQERGGDDEDDEEGQGKWFYWNDQQVKGFIVGLLIFALFSLSQGTRVLCDLWVGYWAEDEQGIAKYKYSYDFYKVYFIVLTWGTVLITVLRSLLFVFVCLGSSYSLHQTLLINVFNAPINLYFDITPMGRILNRFTKDFDNLDALLPDFFLQTLQNCFAVLAIVIVCLTSSTYFIILFIPLCFIFLIIQNFFRKSSREMKRLDNISRSPIYSLFTEILQGLTTIKAFQYTEIFTLKFNHLINQHIGNFFVFWFASRWLALRLDLISNMCTFFVAILAAILKESGNSTNSNLIGIALVYSLQLTALLQWTVRMTIETETNMTSVERLLVFKNILHEKVICKSYESPLINDDENNNSITDKIDNEQVALEEGVETEASDEMITSYPLDQLVHWPQHGHLILQNVFLKYRPDLPYVLNGLNLKIPGGSKVGICGRTAAGKSSLMLALFRIVEIDSSSTIEIDGVNIQSIPLHILRSQITIIPQDPFMFSGTLRENLDPFDQYQDDEILEALARVHLLDDVMNKFPNQLQCNISERGENISVGQRQLICIARALLRKSKVIVMDEATASVDSLTDAKIQRTIREEFKDCTVLTIAHRLETIADYDLVVVMAYGKVAEVGTPMELLRDGENEKDALSSSPRLFKGFIDELGDDRKAAFMDVVRNRHEETLRHHQHDQHHHHGEHHTHI